MNIYEAICNTMKDIGAVGKNDTNSFDRYNYRGIDAVMNALNPAMVKNRIFVVPEVEEHTQEERLSKKGETMIYTVVRVKYTFYADDGSSVSAVVAGEAMDRSDKSTNKAMSAAFKYACFQTFCIPTEEMRDADAESPQAQPKGYPPREQMEQVIARSLRADVLEKWLANWKVGSIAEASDEQIMACYGFYERKKHG